MPASRALAAVSADAAAEHLKLFRHGVLAGLSVVRGLPGANVEQPPARLLLECLRDREADVLRFLSDLRVPPTSNQAERDVRPAKTQVTLPVLARQTFHGGAEAYGFMTAAMGVGAVIGGLFTAARGRTGLRPVIVAAAGFGAAILACAFSPVLGLAYAALLFVGWASVSLIAIGNSTIQLSAEPSMRGRVIALWQVAFQGTTPIGGPAVGWIIAATSPRTGLAVGGASCFVAALGGIALARRSRLSPPPQMTRHEHPGRIARAGGPHRPDPADPADHRAQ